MAKILHCLAFAFFLSPFLSAQNELLLAPKPKQIPHFDTIHTDVRSDPYHWMRQKTNPEVINHLYAENGYADAYMKPSSILMKKIYEEMRSRMKDAFESLPSRSKKLLYFTRYKKGDDYPSYYRKADSTNAEEILLLDMQALSKNYMYFSVNAIGISPNTKNLFYGIDSKGNRLSDVFFKDIASGRISNDTLKGVTGVSWFGDEEVIYTLPEPKTQRAYKAFRHKIGTPQAEDVLIAEELDPTFSLSSSRSSSERFVFLVASHSETVEMKAFDREHPERGFQLILARKKGHIYSVDHFEGDQFYITTNWNAPNYRLMKTTIGSTDQASWKELYPAREDVMIGGYQYYKDFLVLVEQSDARQQLVIVNSKTGKREPIHMIDDPTESVSALGYYEFDEPKLRVSSRSMRHPSEIWDLNLYTGERELIRRDTIPGNYKADDYVTERVYAPAADGTRIPITMIYKKGLKRDGNAFLWMTAYGAYGNPSLPQMNISNLPLLDRGFIYAIAHVRGGDDCGRSWYEQGKLLNKKNTFTDIVSCSEMLIDSGYTSKGKIALYGASAGGLLVGAVLNLRPDLFGCAIAGVPFMDVVNTMLDPTLPLTTFEYDEWGNPNDPVFYHYMKSYAPYENISKQNYPPVLATGGYNDSQVPYWEPAKWVARLRELKTDTNTVLLKTNMDAGHGGNSGRFGGLRDQAFDYAFVLKSLGFEEDYLTIHGQTLDSDGNVLPFVNVHVEGTTMGTASNENGQFSLELKRGNAPVLVFSSLGFKRKSIPLSLQLDVNSLKVKLDAENYQIKTFEVNANAKDPAYAVMKKAIETRKKHLNQVDAYSSDIYIKGTVRLDEIPDKLPFFIPKAQLPDSTDLGLVYLSESVAKYHEKKPDKVKEEMIASKIAGMKQGFSWNRVSDVLMNFYENLVGLTYYADRGFVSPVSESAMFYYKYRMVGTFVDNGHTINRIAMEPRRKADPCFRGEIFIVDDTWNIHSIDVYLTKDAQIEYVDTLFIRQEYMPLQDSLWMPQSLKLMSHISLFGYKATDKSVGVFSNYKVNPNFPPRFFGNEVFKVEEKAGDKDTVYWEETRPMTLTEEEERNYRRADSLERVQSSKPYLDSLDRISNKLNVGKLLLSGYTYRKSIDKEYFAFNPLISAVSFNAVEGLSLSPTVTYSEGKEDYTFSLLTGSIRYGFSDLRWKGSLSFFKLTNPKTFNWWYVEGGRILSQVNDQAPISSLVNAGYSLIDKRNFIRIHEKTGARVRWNSELFNGFMVQAELAWFNRIIPTNHTEYSFRNTDKLYDQNQSVSNTFDLANQGQSSSATYRIAARYRPGQRYETRGNRKVLLPSKWPGFTVEYEQAVPNIFGSNVSYSKAEASVSDNINVGLLGTFKYKASAGSFLSSDALSVIDYKHFNGNQTSFLRYIRGQTPYDFFVNGFSSFNALGFYSNSTTRPFVELHVQQDFQTWITNKFPLLRLARLGTLLGANMLISEGNKPYTEVYLGIDNILKVLRVDFVSQYLPGQPIKPLVRFGIKLN